MLNMTLRLTALAGVIGIGFLFVIQAHRGVNQPVDQPQSRLTGLELAEVKQSFSDEMEPAFSEGVGPVEQSEPVFDDETIENNPELTQISNRTENHTPSSGGLDFSDSENRFLQTELDGSETTESPALLPENGSSETPKPLFGNSSPDSSDAAIQPEFNTPPAITREPLFSSSAETPGDSYSFSERKDAEISGDSLPEFHESSDAETPGDVVSSSIGEFIGEAPGDSVPEFFGQTEAETPGDSVSSPKGKFVGEILGDAIPSESMPKLSESGLSPFGTSDAVISPEGESPKDAHPILESWDQPNPFDSSQSPEINAEITPDQNSDSNHLEQAHPFVGSQLPPVLSDNSDKEDDFFPVDEINTNGTNHSKGNEVSSTTSTASPFPTEEMPAFNPKLNPVPTTNSQTAQSDQPEAFPEAAFPLVLPDREENPLSGQPVSSAESGEQDDPEAPLLLDLNESPSQVQGASPNPFDVTPNAAPLRSNNAQLSDEAVNRDNPPVAQQPQLNIEKVAPQNAVLGEPMIYSIIVQNVGALPVHQVMVVDRIPKRTELMGTIPQAELDGDRLIWKIGTFQPNEKRKILVRITPREVGKIGSVATVHFFSEITAETNIKKPDLKLSMSGPSQIRLGEPVVFRFKVTNTGTKDARQVFIRNILPDGLSHPGGKDLEYSFGTLKAGKSEEIELILTAESPGTTNNRVIVTADGGVKIEKTISLKIVASALIISRTGPKQAKVDHPTTAINLLTNDSNRPLERITVTENIPRGMKFVEATSGGRYDPVTKSVEWLIDRLGPKQSMELKIKLVPTAVGTQVSVVQAVDADGTKIEVTSETLIHGTVALNVDIISLEQPIVVGQQYTLQAFARNRGSATATNVQAKFMVPDELEVVSAQGPAQYVQRGKQIIFSPVPEVKSGMQAIYHLTLKAKQSGKARVRVDINADQLIRPLIRDESISILPAN